MRGSLSTELSSVANISASTASSHLSKLLDCQLITVVAQGKHRYFRLAGKDIAELMESMMGISLNHGVHAKVSTPVHLRKARTCYDHLAGEVAVKIYDSLCQQQWITENGSMITLSGIQYFHEMGIDVPSKHSRKICCACLDWSERRFHLGGYVGAALFSLYESKGWLTRHGAIAGCDACRVLSGLRDCTYRADKAFTPHPPVARCNCRMRRLPRLIRPTGLHM